MSEQALYAAVYADPEADAPRRVLADYLQAQGDPRGEFIALQLLEAPSPEQRAREQELLQLHGKRWSAQLSPLLESTEFARGFPSWARVRSGRLTDLHAACRAQTQGRWRTLEQLELVAEDGSLERLQRGTVPAEATWERLLRRRCCACYQPGWANFNDFEHSYLGTDPEEGRYGEVSLWRCCTCAQLWIHYLLEYEGFSGSGRYFRGPIDEHQARQLNASNAIALLEQLPKYLCGGSYFGGPHWSTAPLALGP